LLPWGSDDRNSIISVLPEAVTRNSQIDWIIWQRAATASALLAAKGATSTAIASMTIAEVPRSAKAWTARNARIRRSTKFFDDEIVTQQPCGQMGHHRSDRCRDQARRADGDGRPAEFGDPDHPQRGKRLDHRDGDDEFRNDPLGIACCKYRDPLWKWTRSVHIKNQQPKRYAERIQRIGNDGWNGRELQGSAYECRRPNGAHISPGRILSLFAGPNHSLDSFLKVRVYLKFLEIAAK
jgi:hypothetical protein